MDEDMQLALAISLSMQQGGGGGGDAEPLWSSSSQNPKSGNLVGVESQVVATHRTNDGKVIQVRSGTKSLLPLFLFYLFSFLSFYTERKILDFYFYFFIFSIIQQVQLYSNSLQCNCFINHLFAIVVSFTILILWAAGDMTKEDVDIIVNAANKQLDHASGLAGAIVKNGGEIIQIESGTRLACW
jgi:hypothetical protein